MAPLPKRYARKPIPHNQPGGRYYPAPMRTVGLPQNFANYTRVAPARQQPAPGATSSLGGPGGMRVIIRANILEKDGPIGTINGLSFAEPIPVGYKQFGRYKILRVGVEIYPETYMEWVVRMTPIPPTSIDTRTELLIQKDCKKFRNLQNGPKQFWYRPMTPRALGWQNNSMTTQNTFEPDAYMYWNGINKLIDGPGGIIGQTLIDVQFDAFTV